MATPLLALLILWPSVFIVYLVLKSGEKKAMRNNNIYFTRAMWDSRVGTLLCAQMEIRRKQYESGGIVDQYGVDSPIMKMYEGLFEQYEEEVRELNRRLALPGLEGLRNKGSKA